MIKLLKLIKQKIMYNIYINIKDDKKRLSFLAKHKDSILSGTKTPIASNLIVF